MRKDMKRIVGDQRGSRVSGPRKGRRFSKAEFRKIDWDEDDSLFVAGHVGNGLEKSLNGRRRGGRGHTEKPILRWLSSQVGRLWNDVWSEMVAELGATRVFEERFRRHFPSIVATRAQYVAGQLLIENWCGQLIALNGPSAPDFYVDPLSGRLHRNVSIVTYRMKQKQLAETKRRELADRMRELGPLKQLHLLSDGNWWEVALTEMDWQRTGAEWPVTDVVHSSKLSDLPRPTLYGRERVYAIAKRPLTAQEIKRHKLRDKHPARKTD